MRNVANASAAGPSSQPHNCPMVHLIFAALFLLGALTAAALGTRDQARNADVTSPTLAASLLCAAALAMMARQPPDFFFKGTVVLALLIAFIATVLMSIQGTPQVVRAGANTVVYFVLWLGFLVIAGRALWTLPGMIGFAAGFAACVALFFAIRTRVSWLSYTILAYSINMALVVGGAAALVALQPALWTVLCLVGTLLYVGVDMVEAWSTWHAPVRRAGLYRALFLAFGALLLGLSVWGNALLNLQPTG